MGGLVGAAAMVCIIVACRAPPGGINSVVGL